MIPMDDRRWFLSGLALGGGVLPAGRLPADDPMHPGSSVIQTPGSYQ